MDGYTIVATVIAPPRSYGPLALVASLHALINVAVFNDTSVGTLIVQHHKK